MPHQYKRRTYDEAKQLALECFRSKIDDNLTAFEIKEMKSKGTVTGGSFGRDWIEEFGSEPETRLHYELQIYLPSDLDPYIEKYYARILVTRDRESEGVWIKWKPAVPDFEALEKAEREILRKKVEQGTDSNS